MSATIQASAAASIRRRSRVLPRAIKESGRAYASRTTMPSICVPLRLPTSTMRMDSRSMRTITWTRLTVGSFRTSSHSLPVPIRECGPGSSATSPWSGPSMTSIRVLWTWSSAGGRSRGTVSSGDMLCGTLEQFDLLDLADTRLVKERQQEKVWASTGTIASYRLGQHVTISSRAR